MKFALINILSFFCLTMSTPIFSMSISNLMLINSEAKDGKAGIFTISNSDDITYFIKTSISKVDVIDNQVIKTPYTKENLKFWDITLKPSKFVVEPQIVKQLMVEEICGSRCELNKDRVYQINVEPVAYETKNESESKVNMMFGFAPYYIIPARNSLPKYDIQYKDGVLRLKNTGNTVLNLVIDQCQSKTKDELSELRKDKNKRCRITYTVLSGRDREFTLPDELRKDTIDVIILNHDESFREERTLREI